MQPVDAIKMLHDELYFESRTAAAYVRASGYCEYCGEELIKSRIGYATAEIDHILPRAHFKDEITGMTENFALSCSLCNGMKKDDRILKEGEDPKTMLRSHRDELVARASRLVRKKREEADQFWIKAKQLFGALRSDDPNKTP